MKRVILFLVFATLLSQGGRAQDSARAEKIDIRALVNQQIENARKNDENPRENASLELRDKKENKSDELANDSGKDEGLAEIASFIENTKKNIWTKLTRLSPFKRRLLTYFLALELFLIGTILAVWYMSKRSGSRKKRVYNLKETVKKMREEKLGGKINHEISKLRGGLLATPIRIDDGGRELTEFAKKAGIAKGEILLAIKVKALLRMHK